MARGWGIIACVVGRVVCVAGRQAGEPVVLNVEYDVPSASADAVAARVRHSAALEADLAKTAANRNSVRDSSFAALGLAGDGVPPGDADIVIHVASPSVGTSQGASLVSGALGQLASLSGLAQRQHSQELRALRGAKFLLQRSANLISDSVSRGGGPASGSAITDAAFVGTAAGRIAELASEVNAGGRLAKSALDQLLVLAADPGVRDAVASSGAPRAAATLLQRPSTDETVRASAGSLLTLLSGMPLAAEVSNTVTGAGEHVEVVLPRPSRVYGPDSVAMQLSAGVPPSAISP